MKISFIICYSSTWPMTVFDKECWPEKHIELDKLILQHTNKLIEQILSIDLNLEVILVDNSNDFITNIEDSRLKILNGYENIKETLPKENQASITAKAYDLGVLNSNGDYLVLQHNDTLYLDNYYPMRKLFEDSVALLEEENLEYITIDAKPSKSSDQEDNFYADCYWFLCRKNFYTKHDIKVGWSEGDNNHNATIVCREKKLKFLHLPGYYEIKLGRYYRETLKKHYPGLDRVKNNIHSFNDIPFLVHIKGGTGLKNFIEHYDIIY